MAGSVPREIRKAAVARVAAGESPYTVAEDIGVAFRTVYDWMDKAGVVGPRVAACESRQEQIAQAAELVSGGMTLTEAAQAVGLKVSVVRHWLVKQGVYTPVPAPPRKRVSQDAKDKAVARVAAGESPYTVAEDVGVAFRTVYDWMDKAGVVGPRGTKKQWERDRHTAEKMFADGVPAASIADTLGLNQATVYQWRKDWAMPAPLSTAAVSTAASPAHFDGMRVGVGKRLTASDRAQIHAGCAQGLSARAIATSIGEGVRKFVCEALI